MPAGSLCAGPGRFSSNQESFPMTLGTFAPKGQTAHPDSTGLRSTLIHAIRDASANAPRSLQRAVGPSEVGTPCSRQLAFKLSRTEPARDVDHDPMPSIIGTATHDWLAEAMVRQNRLLVAAGKPARWLVEQRVRVGPGLGGSADLFDIETGCVFDWKVLGNTTYAQYTAEGPSRPYRVQTHCYGAGFVNAGYTVNRVAIVFLGRAKRLSDMHIWSEPFDPQVATDALARAGTVASLLESGVAPMRFPATPSTGTCRWCPFKGRVEDGYCSGKAE